jgi:Tfp pilus assembly PilM family ATPase
MTGSNRLPIGVDLGVSRIRVACFARSGKGEVRVAAVAARDRCAGPPDAPGSEERDLTAAILEELRDELGTRERACVISLGVRDATVRIVRFPKMTWGERRRAARFEADRLATWDTAQTPSVVRVHPVDHAENLHAIGVARRAALEARVAAVRHAGFRPVGIDHDAWAMRRAFPFVDAVVDIGHDSSSIHTFGASGPLSVSVGSGGAHVTRAIETELSVDAAIAEKRKRILGTAGAGDNARRELAAQIAEPIARSRESLPIRRIALVGNGARLPGLAEELESLTGAIVDAPVSDLLRDGAYPEDVVRAAAPDWTLAVALASWSCS